MNAPAFRHFYDYHFTENRTIWEKKAELLDWLQGEYQQ